MLTDSEYYMAQAKALAAAKASDVVPTGSVEVQDLSAAVTALIVGGASGIGRRDLREFGGVADGTTNNGPAFLAAVNAARTAKRNSPLGGDPLGTLTIELPAGDILITDAMGMLGQEAMTGKIVGIRFIGQGIGITTVIFRPTIAADLCFNDFWLFLQFENITFAAATVGCTFMHSATTHAAQNYRFLNCGFNGWKYNFLLEGNNNNSEYSWINCNSNGTQPDGAWLSIPTSGNDQFLNYWWINCTYQSTSAPFIDAAKGGHFNIYGLDCSNWGSTLTAPGKLINLRGTAHAYGVCNLQATGVRVEAKNANCGLLFSEWPDGTVAFRGVDWSSQAGSVTYGNIISISYVNYRGPVYSFRDSTLAGGINVAFQANDWAWSHRIIVENCVWMQKLGPSDVVTYDVSGAGSNVESVPPVVFSRCVSANGETVFSATGAATWDATIGYQGDLLQTLTPRVLSLRGVQGLPNSGTLKVRLPIGALVTAFEVLSPVGAVGEGDGGAWTLTTGETTPTTIATATVATPLSAGYDTTAVPTVPFFCGTTAKATLVVTPSGVSQQNSGGGLILIKGYW